MEGGRAFDKYVSFASQFAPFLVLHALVPTLDAAKGREFRSVVSLPLKRSVLEKHFVFTRSAVDIGGRWWCCVSYMFLHVDYAHAMANLQGLVLSGPAAVDVLGGVGASLAYLSAGCCAALDPLRLTDLQLERSLKARWADLTAGAGRRLEPLFSALGLDADFLRPPPRLSERRPAPDGFRGAADALEEVMDGFRRTLDFGEGRIDDAARTS